MKNVLALVAVAASPAVATFGVGAGIDLGGHLGLGGGLDLGLGFGGKFGSGGFTCPGNSDNKCDDKWSGGLNWGDLVHGAFDHYNGFDFHGGWSCKAGAGGKGNVVGGLCGGDIGSSLSFGCGKNAGFDKFSVKHFEVDVEFDCRLEFHYDMPDGSSCKQSADCKKGSSNKISNSQCGGATNVHIIFPDQPDKPKDKCHIEIPNIDFDCDDNTPPEQTHGVPTGDVSIPVPTGDIPIPTLPTGDIPIPTLPTGDVSIPIPTLPHVSIPIPTPGKPTEGVPTPGVPDVPTGDVPTGEVPTKTPGLPGHDHDSSELPTGTTTVPEVTAPPATTDMTTSTIYTTTVHTITDCGPEVPNCPAHSTKVVTETVAISTTVCPVTEGGSKPTGTPGKPSTPDTPLPCPDVVPKCLNTWLHVVKECKSNEDVACFCPSKEFVDQTYQCLYAHGETDDIISEAVQFFQGICAPYIPKNPAIVTGVDSVTSCITVTATPHVSVPYTTIIVDTTVTEPCSSNGTPIPGSSTTKHISSEVTVPNIPVATPTSGGQKPGQEQPPTETAAPGSPGSPEQPPAQSTLVTKAPVGTIGAPAPTNALPPPTAGAGRVGMGLGLVIVAVAAAL